MTNFIDRLITEREDLNYRSYQLAKFMGTEAFVSLSAAHQILLKNQLDAMNEYHSILVVRLALVGYDK